MHTYTYLETQQKLTDVLEEAEKKGKVFIKTPDGRTFALMPEQAPTSPLNVPTIKADISTAEIVAILREGREP